ncbi:hypothetical protein C0989_000265 [Termitomyces sp. Mn162]|nr:hypothetical protein C0989_000265 [Termitomyces sp. Mn162]
MDNLLSYIYLLLDAAIVFLFRKWRSSRLPYPPGPKPSLISGNASELPTFFPWLKYAEWAKGYGSIVHVRAYNHHIVILDKLQDANALFEKRSRIYSDRPEVTMVSLMGWDFATPFLRYGDTWHLHRRIFQQAFNKKEIQIIHQPVQILKVRELLRRLLVAPEDFVTHFRTTTGAIVMATVYDKNMSESNLAKFVTFSERAVNMISESFFPSATIVNALPILRHIPTWFPGARFHHFAAECRVYTTGMVEIPFKYVKDKLQDDAISPIEIPEADLKSAMATAFVGAADTVSETFIYAMLVNPEAQRKAQGEIDSVVGRNRLPDFSDRPNLPYVEAVYREVMRWHPVTPLGLAHSTSADDVYNGYFIPKATFNIKKARDEQGNEIDVDESYTSGLVSHKVPHSCSITPRSEKAQTLIIEANAEA